MLFRSGALLTTAGTGLHGRGKVAIRDKKNAGGDAGPARRVGLLSEPVRLVKGWFADTVPTAPIERIAVLRLDGDLYESTIQVLEGFYPRLSPGGFCIIDDYGAMLSCRAAVEDFRRERGVGEPLVNIDGKGVLWEKVG